MKLSALAAEAIATFMLCFIGGGAICADALLSGQGSGLLGIAIAHGLALAIAVSATMNISGGHVNPAVTIAMLVTGRIKPVAAIAYIVAQCLGGMVGGLLLYVVLFTNLSAVHGGDDVISKAWNGTPHYDVMQLGEDLSRPTTAPVVERQAEAGGRAALRAVIIEAALTFLLVFAVFGTAVDPRHPNIGGFGIGLTIAADILVGGPLTGAAMNPARVFGTGWIMNSPEFWSQHWVYWVGPIAGAIVAAAVYELLIMPKKTPAPVAAVDELKLP